MQEADKDLFSSLEKGRKILTVSELTQDIKLVLESAFTQVWVEGEISGISRIATGTVFFSLKDNSSVLRCVMFASFAAAVKFELKDGLRVVLSGRVSVYEKDGKYQFYAEKIEPKGLGSLQLALEQLKQKLEKEGLFSARHKKPIPYLPSRIGLVTSLQGAAIKDIFKVLERRFKDVHLVINSVRVQGEGSAAEIAQAIKDLNLYNDSLPDQDKIEVMIVGRGGGSIEDLWSFNEEVVARAIFDSDIPVISAVGHERDWTIADLVADMRSPTPSAAAEMVLPRKEDLEKTLSDLGRILERSFADIADNFQEGIDSLAHRLKLSMEHALVLDANVFDTAVKKLRLLNPAYLIEQYRLKADDLGKQICVRTEHFLRIKQTVFEKAVEKLSNLSPLNIISRGYSITFKLPSGEIVKDIRSVRAGEIIKTKVNKGLIYSSVTKLEEE